MSAVIEVANSVLELFVAIFFFGKMLNRRKMKCSYRIAAILFVLAIHIVRSFIPLSTYVNIGITCLLWGVLIVILYEDLALKKLISFALYFVSVLIADVFCRFIMSWMINSVYEPHSTTPGLERYIGMIIINVLIFSILSIFIIISKRKRFDVTVKYRAMMALFPIFSLFIVISTDIFIMKSGTDNILYIFALLIIFIGLLYFNIMTFEFMDTYSAKIRLAAAEELIKNQAESYQLLEINETELRRLRHNINEHMEVMKGLIRYNACAESTELIESLEKLASLPTSIIYTGDAALDSILNVESTKAASYGIKYLVKAQNLSQPINIPAIDKSTVLCNAINNAIEACQKLDSKEKFVVIDISSDKNRVKIHIENSSLPQNIHNNSILTSKKDAIDHGFGLDSIKRIVGKYNGIFSISYSCGITTCSMQFDNGNMKIHG